MTGLLIYFLAAFVVSGAGKNIIERSIPANTFVVGPILVIFVLGFLLRRTHTAGTFVGMVLGVIAGVTVAFGHKLGYWNELSFQLPIPVSFVTTVSVGAVASLLLPMLFLPQSRVPAVARWKPPASAVTCEPNVVVAVLLAGMLVKLSLAVSMVAAVFVTLRYYQIVRSIVETRVSPDISRNSEQGHVSCHWNSANASRGK